MNASTTPVSVAASNAVSDFSSNKYVSGAKDFVESNGMIAKFAFLILVVLIFVTALQAGSTFLSWLMSPKKNPILIDGMIDARHMKIIPQNPSKKNSIPILRSVNDVDGLEFTWSAWLFIEDYVYREGKYKHIFHKGNDGVGMDGINQPNNAPGLYMDKYTNNLIVFMNTFESATEKVVIDDIPIHKWVNVVVRVIQRQLDVYINGTLVKRHILSGVPKQNYGDVYVSMNGGFAGYISNLRYFDTGIGTNKIRSLTDSGPNTKLIGENMKGDNPHYLSMRWYFNGANDMYNPGPGPREWST